MTHDAHLRISPRALLKNAPGRHQLLSVMEPQESHISVSVCREEKLVLGLSRRTTCADVVRVLLEEQQAGKSRGGAVPIAGCARSYHIVERWRGLERVLPGKTKILRLWDAWGEERADVKFVLVQGDAPVSSHGPRCAEARVVPSKRSHRLTGGTGPGLVRSISPDKQRRVVRKAFRKLEKINRSKRTRAARRDASSAERMETLAHLVISRDLTIRQQTQRLSELDAEIERYEAKVHTQRIRAHGVNYVQDTYLATRSIREEDAEPLAAAQDCEEPCEEPCEELLGLEEQLWQQEALADTLCARLQEELNRRWMQRRSGALRDASPSSCAAVGNELLLEAERARTQLEASSYIGLRLNADLARVRDDLQQIEALYAARREEMTELLEKVKALDLEESWEEGGRDAETVEVDSCLQEARGQWVEEARCLSITHCGNDDDSDTGLSSMHSQESDSLPVTSD